MSTALSQEEAATYTGFHFEGGPVVQNEQIRCCKHKFTVKKIHFGGPRVELNAFSHAIYTPNSVFTR